MTVAAQGWNFLFEADRCSFLDGGSPESNSGLARDPTRFPHCEGAGTGFRLCHSNRAASVSPDRDGGDSFGDFLAGPAGEAVSLTSGGISPLSKTK
jgi:hypothetical protein